MDRGETMKKIDNLWKKSVFQAIGNYFHPPLLGGPSQRRQASERTVALNV